MSATQDRLLADYLPRVEAACQEGRGEALLFQFYKEQAEAVADSVFLLLQQTVLEAESDPEIDADALLDVMRRFTEQRGRLHIESVAETCVAFGMPAEHQVQAETVSADAFRERLNRHFDTTGWGGSA